MKIVESEITAVTVFTDRAQVSRNCKIKLDIGEHQLCFDNLPESIEQNSIRVGGIGKAIIHDVNFRTLNYIEPKSDKIKNLSEKQTELNEKLKKQEKIKELSDLEREFLDRITEKITTPEKIKPAGELNPDSWIQMISFYRTKLDDLEAQKMKADEEIRNINNEIMKLDDDIRQLGSVSDKSRNQVEVAVTTEEDAEFDLELIYIVYGPGWYPFYDLRVSGDDKKIFVTYNAMVSQATSENWNDVQLKLSTAQPAIDGNLPEIDPWRVNFYSPDIEFGRSMSASSPMKKSASINEMEDDFDDESDMMKSSMEILPQESSVETQAASVVFVPTGSNTVLCDNTPYKVSVLIEEFPSDFIYGCIPKLSPFTYLRAKVCNKSEYPLLAGSCNVFLDNNFVANTSLDNVSPDEEFYVSLGIDERISSKRKFIKKFEKKEGLISKKTKYIYEYIFIIENKKKTDEIVILKDHLPISGHQDIVVELIEPQNIKNSKTIQINDEKILEWRLNLKAGEKIEIPFSFSVEYPVSELIAGLD